MRPGQVIAASRMASACLSLIHQRSDEGFQAIVICKHVLVDERPVRADDDDRGETPDRVSIDGRAGPFGVSIFGLLRVEAVE